VNPITGEVEVQLNGETFTLRFDWNALAAIEEAHGENPNLFTPDVVASVAAIGFKRHHPEMTAERIMEISPPLMPFAQTVQKALQWSYFGLEFIPDEDEDSKKKTSPDRGGFWRLLLRRWRKK